MDKPGLIVVAGPTASGKTACAVELCRMIDGEVVSADSMQIYRGMDILSAMPTQEEMRGVPHHMLGIADPSEKYSAAMYRERANEIIADIHARGKHAVVFIKQEFCITAYLLCNSKFFYKRHIFFK